MIEMMLTMIEMMLKMIEARTNVGAMFTRAPLLVSFGCNFIYFLIVDVRSYSM